MDWAGLGTLLVGLAAISGQIWKLRRENKSQHDVNAGVFTTMLAAHTLQDSENFEEVRAELRNLRREIKGLREDLSDLREST